MTLLFWISVFWACSEAKQKGVNFLNGQWSAPKYDSANAQQSFGLLKRSGTDYLALTFAWYQWNITSYDIYPRPNISPTEAELTAITKLAHSQGSKVMLRPLVDPDWSNPQTKGTWRGMIGANFSAAAWNEWFNGYTAFIVHFAELAQKIGADEYSIGGELILASHQAPHWRNLITQVRKVYRGPILYGANHGNENFITWWDAVDFIAIDAYYSLLPSNPNPTLPQLLGAWVPIKNSLQTLSRKYKKPVIFSEIGFCSQRGTNVNPAACIGSGLDLDAQVMLYESVYQTFWGLDWFEGIFWWAWLSNPSDGGMKDTSFTPNGKPAEQVMLKYNRQ